MNPKTAVPAANITLVGALGLLFIGLKLTGAIDWSWWLVLMPFWLPPTIVLLLLVLGGLMVRIANWLEKEPDK